MPPPRQDERLRPTERLKAAPEFRKVFREGRCFRTGPLRIHARESGLGLSRLGLVVSSRVGNAVVRNRIRRLLREVFRKSKHRLQPPVDVILVAQGAPRTYLEYAEAFGQFASRSHAAGARPSPRRERRGQERAP